ncbi:MAG TPA: hypothetical protein VJP77_04865, partial [Planctomycetota bacterium]|nr:hypothetical protein [Planctomycetota bacterium]
PFEPIGGGAEATEPGEVVYRDAARVLTRRWNYRDGDATKIGAATREFVVMLESPSPAIDPAAVAAATEDLARRYRLCFRGTFTASTLRLSPTAREFEL